MNTNLLIVAFAVAYGVLGAAAGYLIHRLSYGFDEDWKNSSPWWQIADVIGSIALFSLLAFWLSVGMMGYFKTNLHFTKQTRTILEFIMGVMFLETLFVFSGDFESKIQHISYAIVGTDPDELWLY